VNDSLREKLKNSGIKFIRLLWCDNANVIRAKAAHVDFLDDCIDYGIGITVAQQALPVMADVVAPDAGLMPVGEVRLMPDWSTLTVLPYAKGHAQVLSDMIVGETGNVWEHCLREFLRRQTEKLAERDLTLKAAFENEFYLLYRNSEGALKPVDETIFSQAASFVAGVLDHLPALAAVTIPSPNSYRRIRPHCWVGAFRVWGYQNREAVVRVCGNPKGSQADRFEFKASDASSNPYLALGALIAAGLDGLERNLELPAEVTVDPGHIPEEERRARGIDLLPQNLSESLEALRKDQVLLKALGNDLARSFTAVRQAEWEALEDMSFSSVIML